jgi:ribosomal protein S27AE
MKRCFRCRQLLPITSFYAHRRMKDGHLNKCKSCCILAQAERRMDNLKGVAAYERARSQRPERKQQALAAQRRRRRLHPEKTKAYNAVARAVRSGRLVRQPCAACGHPKAQAHHDDYMKPLDVRWLCFRCHRELAHHQVCVPF